jgi:methylmalonyl-CoA/ethylmalonyl-CoA epimerase
MLSSFKFHHIGLAVKSIDKTAQTYELGGYNRSGTTFDPIQNVNICWLRKEGMPMVELLEPVDDKSPVCKILEKNGVTPYHTCYIVDNLESVIVDLRKQKYVQVSQPAEAVAISGSRVCFMFNKNIGLIELVETPAIITE